MNCKPGDLATIVRGKRSIGRLVEVLYAAPQIDFYLPDGYPHAGSSPGDWVIRSLGAPFSAPTEERAFLRVSMYVVGHDSGLRPLRGDSEKFDAENDLEITA